MTLIGCVGSKAAIDALLLAVEEAVKDDSVDRLDAILQQTQLSPEELDKRNVLHQAAWLGYPGCVQLLLGFGLNPDEPHRKNGCTPLHLAHFCTIEDTAPGVTIKALLGAGAAVNNPGGMACGRRAIEHAIQHQRLDAVRALLMTPNCHVPMEAVLCAVDVANPQILGLLLESGAVCGPPHPSARFWGSALHRVIYTPLKCPKECYKSMFRQLAQATVCAPPATESFQMKSETCVNQENVGTVEGESGDPRSSRGGGRSNKRSWAAHQQYVEGELRVVSRDYVELAHYLYAMLIRNGYTPSESAKSFMSGFGPCWVEEYLSTPVTLRDLAIRVLRTHAYKSGNIAYGLARLKLPSTISNMIMFVNPL